MEENKANSFIDNLVFVEGGGRKNNHLTGINQAMPADKSVLI